MSEIQIRRVHTVSDTDIQALSDVLIDCVEGGASVSFMHPMTREKADVFWRGVASRPWRAVNVFLSLPKIRQANLWAPCRSFSICLRISRIAAMS